MSPVRVQRKRTKGWRMPENTVSVARPGRWGNSWQIGSTGWTILPGGFINREPHEPLTREQCIESFRNSTEYQLSHDPGYLAELRGKNLACFCRLDQPCHGDVLLELANRDG
jgi:hypothetical protein